MKAKSLLKKATATVLAAAMTASVLPAVLGNDTVRADTFKNADNTCLGTSKLAAPATPTGTNKWRGSYVYFGTYEGEPIKFRVLDPSTTKFGGSTLFLDSDKVLYNNRMDGNSNEWKSSEIFEFLNSEASDGFLYGFSSAERSAIAQSKISTHDIEKGTTAGKVSVWTGNNFPVYTPLTSEKVFLLDIEDASNIAYGYSTADTPCTEKIKDGGNWWLRSSYGPYEFAYCDDTGELNMQNMTYTYGIAPAMNIKQSSILFSTAISGTMGAKGAEYKLTLFDDSIDFGLWEECPCYAYENEVYIYTDSYETNQDSVLILDKEYGSADAEILYYGSLFESSYIDFDALGLDLAGWNSSYYVYAFGEIQSDSEYETDYASSLVLVPEPEINYNYGSFDFLSTGVAHVQDKGNVTSYVDEDGYLTLGTVGEGKRLESITINFNNPTDLSGTLQYRVHVQDIGWMEWVDAGNPAGTSGQSKRIEAIEMRLTGELAEYFSVEYFVHIQDYGDAQGWVKDGALAGTTGESKRIEEITVGIEPIGCEGATYVKYRVHVQDFGWESKYAYDGEMSGTSGQAKRLEGIEICLEGLEYSGGIKYKTHVQNIGWEGNWSYDGEMSGTQGQALRLEGIMIELYGDVANYYDVYYRVHAEDIGWLSWACNGDPAGTAGRSARLEAIQIVLVPKGEPVPGETYEGITSVSPMCFVEGFGDAVG